MKLHSFSYFVTGLIFESAVIYSAFGDSNNFIRRRGDRDF